MKARTKFYLMLLALYTAGLLAFSSFACESDSPARENKEQPTQTTDVHLASTQAPTPTVSDVAPSVQPDAPVQLPTPQTTPPARTEPSPPIICVPVDFSGSVKRFGITRVTAQHFEPILNLLDRVGGSLAVGSIHDRSAEHPLLRIRIEVPAKPPEASATGDVFTRNKQRRAYRKALPAYTSREEERRARNQVLLADFRVQLKEFLDRPRTSPYSDVWNALRRCQTYLLEPRSTHTGKAASLLFIVPISDGRHNTTSLYRPLDRSIQVFAVTGVAGLGDFGRLKNVQWFEGPAAAFLFIVASVEGR